MKTIYDEVALVVNTILKTPLNPNIRIVPIDACVETKKTYTFPLLNVNQIDKDCTNAIIYRDGWSLHWTSKPEYWINVEKK